jgi:hypothetical protein
LLLLVTVLVVSSLVISCEPTSVLVTTTENVVLTNTVVKTEIRQITATIKEVITVTTTQVGLTNWEEVVV